MTKYHNPSKIHAPGPYSHGVEVQENARLLFISGQVGQDPTGAIVSGIEAQTRTAFENLTAILTEAGMTPANLVKLTIYLTDEANTPGFMMAGGAYLPKPPPAITLLYIKALASPALLVEVEAVAAA